jgi:ectoine hydroxylase-related dioxygenase (phytanoyl-CoA dioxygenase family)
MPDDLGKTHGRLTDLFPLPASPDEWRRYALSEDQVRHFQDNGYLHGVPLLNDEQIEALGEQLEDMVDPAHEGRELFYEYHSNESENPDGVLFHALGAWRVRPAFHDLLWNPAFLMAAYQLLGTDMRLFHDQLFSKPAKHGGVVAWHQDYSYWTWTTPMSHLTCWIGLDDVSPENGCMYYVPGSHRWGLLEKKPIAGDMDAVRESLAPEQVADFDRKIPVEMKKGEASFHHPLLMHGSYENRSDRRRRATLINVFADGVVSNREEDGLNAPGADNYPRVPSGDAMGGQYYPLLFNAGEALGDQLNAIPTISKTSSCDPIG